MLFFLMSRRRAHSLIPLLRSMRLGCLLNCGIYGVRCVGYEFIRLLDTCLRIIIYMDQTNSYLLSKTSYNREAIHRFKSLPCCVSAPVKIPLYTGSTCVSSYPTMYVVFGTTVYNGHYQIYTRQNRENTP